jgi:hypothetical protein
MTIFLHKGTQSSSKSPAAMCGNGCQEIARESDWDNGANPGTSETLNETSQDQQQLVALADDDHWQDYLQGDYGPSPSVPRE